MVETDTKEGEMKSIRVVFEPREMKSGKDIRNILKELEREYVNILTFGPLSSSSEQKIGDFSRFLKWLMNDMDNVLTAHARRKVLNIVGSGTIAGLTIKDGRFSYDLTEAERAINKYVVLSAALCNNCAHIRFLNATWGRDEELICNRGYHGLNFVDAHELMVCNGEAFKYYYNDGKDSSCGMRLERTEGEDKSPIPFKEIVKELFNIDL